MYKVLIVDDEVLVRVGLKSTIDWGSLGFSVIAEASNGEQAYEVYRLHYPDVIITDIRMPKQDGLWLTKKIRQENPRVKILILTCYNEFEYAREALKNGADDYILKSEIEDEDLIGLILGLKKNLDAELGEAKRMDDLKKQIDINVDTLKEKVLVELLNSGPDFNENLMSECSDLGFKLNDSQFSFIMMLRDDAERQPDFSERKWQHMNSAILNIASGIIADSKTDYLVKGTDNGLLILLAKKFVEPDFLHEIVETVCGSVSQYFDISLSIAVSRVFKDIRETGGVYHELCLKAEQLFYEGDGCWIAASEKPLRAINIFTIKKNYEQLLIKYLDEEDESHALDLLEQTEAVFRQNNAKSMETKLFYANLIGAIYERYHHCLDSGDETGDYPAYHNRIMAATKMRRVVRLLKEIIVKVIRNIQRYRLTNSNYIIKKALDYIESNYDKEISTQFLSGYLNLSKQYVCYLFKKETGLNISLYINKLRIEKAKHLVLNTHYKIKEIYDKLGFSDQQYFCKTFKRLTGMTVIQYRDSILKK